MPSDDAEEITPGQVRAARAFLRWSAHDLAEAASLGTATVQRAEARDDRLGMTAANAKALRSALEAQGVEFLGGDDPGVRLRRGALMAGGDQEIIAAR